MNDFLEYEKSKKTVKVLNLDDFSVEDLDKYLIELKNEINRAEKEVKKKTNLLKEAKKFFK